MSNDVFCKIFNIDVEEVNYKIRFILYMHFLIIGKQILLHRNHKNLQNSVASDLFSTITEQLASTTHRSYNYEVNKFLLWCYKNHWLCSIGMIHQLARDLPK